MPASIAHVNVPAPAAAVQPIPQQQQSVTPSQRHAPTASSSTTDGQDDDDDRVAVDTSRIWSADVLLQLVHIWRRVELSHPRMNRVDKSQLVYDEFHQKIECSSSASARSRKAVDDKLYSMKQMYRFIVEMNRDFQHRSAGRAGAGNHSWFDLSKQERRAIRSLHGIRVPNISLEVFGVLDSVLGRNGFGTKEKKTVKQQHVADQRDVVVIPPQVPAPPQPVPEMTPQDLLLDGKRNWSDDLTFQLARAWNDVQREFPSLRGSQLSEQVYVAFKSKVRGSMNRSRKAVEDKMQAMKEMYRFVKAYEDKRTDGDGQSKPCWFDLAKPERRRIRAVNKIKVTNLSRALYSEVDAIMKLRSEPNAAFFDLVASGTDPTSSLSVPHAGAGAMIDDSSARQSASANGSQQLAIDATVRVVQSTESREGTNVDGAGAAAATTDDRHYTATTTSGVRMNRASAARDGQTHKRRKTQESPPTIPPVPGFIDSMAAADYFIAQIRALHEQDRIERRQQHAEHMAAIKELADLLKRQHGS
ncbi:hypothetical protein FI667_g8550, partial [Globisporangium splendens]